MSQYQSLMRAIYIIFFCFLTVSRTLADSRPIQRQTNIRPPPQETQQTEQGYKIDGLVDPPKFLFPYVPLSTIGDDYFSPNLTQSNGDQKESQAFKEFLDAKITDYVIAIFTIFIAWFTCGLRNATISLWGTTDTLVKGADVNAERQLRAYVLVVKSRLDNFGVGQSPEVHITIKNCGQTPASDFRHSACAGFDEFPPSLKPPSFKGIDQGAIHVLAPAMESHSIVPLRRILQQHEVNGIMKGVVALYVVGRIEYQDVFGNTRTTEYRLFANNITDILNGGMSACSEGNHYT